MGKAFKVFFGDPESQEHWLNGKSDAGQRLKSASKLFYEFEPCKPGEYRYRVEWVIDKSKQELLAYREFLEEMGLRTVSKNFGFGSYSYGKVRLGFTGGKPVVRTAPGTINSELLIVEKKNDGKPFDLFTARSDKLSYYRKIRDSFLYGAAGLTALIVLGNLEEFGLTGTAPHMPVWKIVLTAAAAAVMVPLLATGIRAAMKIRQLKRETSE